MLGIPEGPSGVAVVVCPAQEPAAAGTGGTTGPWGAGGVWLFPENLYGSIHRGTSPTGRRLQAAGEASMLERGEREKETEVLSLPPDVKPSEICTC